LFSIYACVLPFQAQARRARRAAQALNAMPVLPAAASGSGRDGGVAGFGLACT